MPIHLPQAAGKPYRPSNGTGGEMFHEQFCHQCKHDKEWREKQENPCEILGNALFHDTDEEEYPKEWKYDPDGRPTCTAFEREEPSGD